MTITSRLEELRALRSRIDLEIDQELACMAKRLTYEQDRERQERAARRVRDGEVDAHPYVGTETGYHYHIRDGTPVCPPCRLARRTAETARAARRRAKKREASS